MPSLFWTGTVTEAFWHITTPTTTFIIFWRELRCSTYGPSVPTWLEAGRSRRYVPLVSFLSLVGSSRARYGPTGCCPTIGGFHRSLSVALSLWKAVEPRLSGDRRYCLVTRRTLSICATPFSTASTVPFSGRCICQLQTRA